MNNMARYIFFLFCFIHLTRKLSTRICPLFEVTGVDKLNKKLSSFLFPPLCPISFCFSDDDPRPTDAWVQQNSVGSLCVTVCIYQTNGICLSLGLRAYPWFLATEAGSVMSSLSRSKPYIHSVRCCLLSSLHQAPASP